MFQIGKRASSMFLRYKIEKDCDRFWHTWPKATWGLGEKWNTSPKGIYKLEWFVEFGWWCLLDTHTMINKYFENKCCVLLQWAPVVSIFRYKSYFPLGTSCVIVEATSTDKVVRCYWSSEKKQNEHWEGHKLWNQTDLWVPTLPLTRCVTISMLFNLCDSAFSFIRWM